MPSAQKTSEMTIDDLDEALELIEKIKQAVGEVIYGQTEAVDLCLNVLLCGGHGLIVGLPGLAKSQLVSTLSTVLNLDHARIQFTPDLMPSDILGSEILDIDEQGKRSFRFIEGPVFNKLIMADEINRASPRTQSALLQAMQEKTVTISGKNFNLPAPFHVLATQNPIEQEGTFGLPEAQLDRFILEIVMDYPDEATERTILIKTTGHDIPTARKVLKAKDLQRLQALVRILPIGESVVEAILTLTRTARPEALPDDLKDKLTWGAGPRAGQALMLAVRARAMMQGRLAPSLDDVKALADPVLRHRLGLSYAARAEGWTPRKITDRLIDRISL